MMMTVGNDSYDDSGGRNGVGSADVEDRDDGDGMCLGLLYIAMITIVAKNQFMEKRFIASHNSQITVNH